MHSFLVNTIYVFCSYGTFIILFLFLKCINQALLPTTQRQHECTAMQDKKQDNVSPRLLDYWIINCPLIANQYSFYYIAIKQLDLAIVISIVVYQGLCFLQIYVCSAYIKQVTQRLFYMYFIGLSNSCSSQNPLAAPLDTYQDQSISYDIDPRTT